MDLFEAKVFLEHFTRNHSFEKNLAGVVWLAVHSQLGIVNLLCFEASTIVFFHLEVLIRVFSYEIGVLKHLTEL